MIFYRSYTFILLQFFNVCDIFFKTRVIFAIEIIEFDTRNLFIVFLHEYISNYIDYPRSYFFLFFYIPSLNAYFWKICFDKFLFSPCWNVTVKINVSANIWNDRWNAYIDKGLEYLQILLKLQITIFLRFLFACSNFKII